MCHWIYYYAGLFLFFLAFTFVFEFQFTFSNVLKCQFCAEYSFSGYSICQWRQGNLCISMKCDFVRVNQTHSSNAAAHTTLNVTFSVSLGRLMSLITGQHCLFTEDCAFHSQKIASYIHKYHILQCLHLSLGPLG